MITTVTSRRPPVIGITLDIDNLAIDTEQACYILRDNIFAAVAEAGAVPLALPHYANAIDAYLDRLDGVIITGDIQPYRLGNSDDTESCKTRRANFEQALIHQTLKRKLPLLGICGGMQLLALAKGASLIDLPATAEQNAISHWQAKPYSRSSHTVTITPGTVLDQLLQRSQLSVNSIHGQTVTRLPDSVVISARSGDGLIEGIELNDADFALGVQWHPEYRINAAEKGLFKGLVRSAKEWKR